MPAWPSRKPRAHMNLDDLFCSHRRGQDHRSEPGRQGRRSGLHRGTARRVRRRWTSPRCKHQHRPLRPWAASPRPTSRWLRHPTRSSSASTCARPARPARLPRREKVDIRLYRVIYQAIEDINAARVGLLSPDIVEKDTGIAEVRETFKVPKAGTIAGCYITEGELNRDDKVRIVRDGTVIYEGNIGSLRRFKDDVKSVAARLRVRYRHRRLPGHQGWRHH